MLVEFCKKVSEVAENVR